MFFQYAIILPDSHALLQSHHLHILYLLLLLSNLTLIFSLSQALLCLISCPSKTAYFTPAAGLPHPIFFLLLNLGISSYLFYPQDTFQLYPTFLCIYHSPCKQFQISCSSWTMSVNLCYFLLTSFQTIIKSLTLSLASSANSCFCGNPSASSCVSAILLLGRNSSLGSTTRKKWEATRHHLQANDRKNHKARGPLWGSNLQIFIPLIYKCFLLVPWIWWWGGSAVKGICVLKLWDAVGCLEIIK